jgi:hypothetical protein
MLTIFGNPRLFTVPQIVCPSFVVVPPEGNECNGDLTPIIPDGVTRANIASLMNVRLIGFAIGRAIRFELVCAGVLLLVAPFLASPGLVHPDPFLVGLSVFGIAMIAYGFQSPRGLARKQYAAMIDGSEYEASINEEAMTTRSSTGYSVIQGAAFSRVIQSENAVGIVDKAMMYVMPRRAFTQDQWAEFLSLAPTTHSRLGWARSEVFACSHQRGKVNWRKINC